MDGFYIKLISKQTAKNIIIKNHYSKKWTKCRYALGIFKKQQCEFFENDNDVLIGCLVYGHPIGRQVVNGLSDLVNDDNVLELTRLWIQDDTPKNMESWVISQSFHWLKRHDKNIKILVSYSDPSAGHKGTIYQATNWLYQEILNTSNSHHFMVSFDQKNWLHPRNLVTKYGTEKWSELINILPKPFYKKLCPRKYRYIYILSNKKERGLLLKSLKHPISPYPKNVSCDESIIKVE